MSDLPKCQFDVCENVVERPSLTRVSKKPRRFCRKHRGGKTTADSKHGTLRRLHLGAKCAHCDASDPVVLDVDHILSRALGGTDAPSNLVTLCANCHRRKTKHDAEELRRIRGIVKQHPAMTSKVLAAVTGLALVTVKKIRKEP